MKELKVMYRAYGANIEVGTLADDGNDVLFQYSPEAIAKRLELSPVRLPLRTLAYPDQQQHLVNIHRVPGLLYDSLPDSWGFRLMERRMRARGIEFKATSTVDRLAYLGENTMGALTYSPGTESLTDTKDLTLVELASEMQALLIDDSHELLDEVARTGSSPGGARPKAMVWFNPETGKMSTQAEQVPSAEPWLIKFPAREDEPDSCALEELYARIAHQCNMGMTQTRFFELSKGLTAFGTRRFDRQGAHRVHVHSLAGLLHINFQIPSVGYEDFFKATRRLTRDNRELKKAVQRCVYNVLMNNRDDHSKNVSFILDQEGNWRLAPPFDLTFCAGYQGEHFLDVAGEGRNPGRAHIIKAAQGAGLSPKDTEAVIDQMLDCATDKAFKTFAKGLPIRAKTLSAVAKVLEENRKRLASK
jgi:serine/threonine-protein kinase HipA